MYEPFFDDLHQVLLQSNGPKVKYIISADMVNQGRSFAINEDKLGHDGECWTLLRVLNKSKC